MIDDMWIAIQLTFVVDGFFFPDLADIKVRSMSSPDLRYQSRSWTKDPGEM